MKRNFSIINFQFSTRRGFTLIELLIVITIIGVLVTIASVNYIAIRERARDAERKSDLSQIQTALELYRSDAGSYPVSLPSCNTALTNAGATITYLKKSPCDPLKPTTKYRYYPTGATPMTYFLFACLENEKDSDTKVEKTPRAGVTTPCATGEVYYVVENP